MSRGGIQDSSGMPDIGHDVVILSMNARLSEGNEEEEWPDTIERYPILFDRLPRSRSSAMYLRYQMNG